MLRVALRHASVTFSDSISPLSLIGIPITPSKILGHGYLWVGSKSRK
jgi:hypothetical protein